VRQGSASVSQAPGAVRQGSATSVSSVIERPAQSSVRSRETSPLGVVGGNVVSPPLRSRAMGRASGRSTTTPTMASKGSLVSFRRAFNPNLGPISREARSTSDGTHSRRYQTR